MVAYSYILHPGACCLRACINIKNRRARPVKYAVQPKAGSSWASLNMGLLGSIIFLFPVIHMTNFWGRYKFTEGTYREYRKDLLTGKLTSSVYLPIRRTLSMP